MNDLEKWEFLRDVPERDSKHPAIRRMARELNDVALLTPEPDRTYVILAHAIAGRGIRFQRDTTRVGGEDIAGFTREPTPSDAVDALERGRDDCDAKARLMVALCLAGGVTARMMPLWRHKDGDSPVLQHVYAEVLLEGRWQPCETILARAVIGEQPLSVPKEANGKWLYT